MKPKRKSKSPTKLSPGPAPNAPPHNSTVAPMRLKWVAHASRMPPVGVPPTDPRVRVVHEKVNHPFRGQPIPWFVSPFTSRAANGSLSFTPRQLRVQYPGAIHHVMSQGDRREDILLDDMERRGKHGRQKKNPSVMPHEFSQRFSLCSLCSLWLNKKNYNTSLQDN